MEPSVRVPHVAAVPRSRQQRARTERLREVVVRAEVERAAQDFLLATRRHIITGDTRLPANSRWQMSKPLPPGRFDVQDREVGRLSAGKHLQRGRHVGRP